MKCRYSPNFVFTYFPGNEESEMTLKSIKSRKESWERVVLMGRLGKENPNAQKYKDRYAANKKIKNHFGGHPYQYIAKEDAAYFDVYVYLK